MIFNMHFLFSDSQGENTYKIMIDKVTNRLLGKDHEGILNFWKYQVILKRVPCCHQWRISNQFIEDLNKLVIA